MVRLRMVPLPPHRAYALGFFRSSVCFALAVGAFAQDDPKTRAILITLLFAIDALSWHLIEYTSYATNSVYNRVWHDTLSNRMAMEALVETYRAGGQINIGGLVKEGTEAARLDIEKFFRENTAWYDWAGSKRPLWAPGDFCGFGSATGFSTA